MCTSENTNVVSCTIIMNQWKYIIITLISILHSSFTTHTPVLICIVVHTHTHTHICFRTPVASHTSTTHIHRVTDTAMAKEIKTDVVIFFYFPNLRLPFILPGLAPEQEQRQGVLQAFPSCFQSEAQRASPPPVKQSNIKISNVADHLILIPSSLNSNSKKINTIISCIRIFLVVILTIRPFIILFYLFIFLYLELQENMEI